MLLWLLHLGGSRRSVLFLGAETTHKLRRVVSSGEISPKFVDKSAPCWTSEAGVGLSEVTYSLQMGTWGSCSCVCANGVTCNFVKSHASFGNGPSSPECHLEGVEPGKLQGWETWERRACLWRVLQGAFARDSSTTRLWLCEVGRLALSSTHVSVKKQREEAKDWGHLKSQPSISKSKSLFQDLAFDGGFSSTPSLQQAQKEQAKERERFVGSENGSGWKGP